jgi:hypothetical protein
MAHSTCAAKAAKPPKPYPGFPLTIHPSGRFCKKIKGTTFYFGSWAEGGQKALDRFNKERDIIYATGTRPDDTDALTTKDAVNDFLNRKWASVDSGELSARSWADYGVTCERVAEVFGSGRVVATLMPDDFGKLRADLAKGKRKKGQGTGVNCE